MYNIWRKKPQNIIAASGYLLKALDFNKTVDSFAQKLAGKKILVYDKTDHSVMAC